ncbi:type II toxin-antitoxin system VapC family toxin [Lapillicoccus sp.]|uniref:type II toxin-antitoxin system VapC family toxin n=1 Tax=Lapillicoccus sp. TaxID=1909287 RepID=UPI0025DB608E|nr:type II toxin-antitoxin system VapC family toxin [Lapillicoccus sp.]
MIVDSSALVAILTKEPTRASLLAALIAAPSTTISAGTLLEIGIVVDRRGDATLSRRLDDLIASFAIEVRDVTAEQAAIGRAAYRDYGKGSQHPAQLNFGDCFAYALARVTGEPLLYVGNDFTHTDLRDALAP